MRGIVVLAALLGSPAAIAQDWTLAVEHGGLSSDFREDPMSLRVGEIEDATTFALAATYGIDRGWYAHAAFDRTRFRFQDPSFSGCPLGAGLFLGGIYCQLNVPSGVDEFIEARSDRLSVRLGHVAEAAGWISPYFEAGFAYGRSGAGEDFEARALAECRTSYAGTGLDLPAPAGCSGVSRHADFLSLSARAGARFPFGSRWQLRAGFGYESRRFEIYRNVAVRAFVERNCATESCFAVAPERLDDRRRGSETWAEAELEFRATGRTAVYARIEGGGTRDLDGFAAGIRVAF